MRVPLFLLLFVAAPAIASAEIVLVDRADLNDYQYSYGGITATINTAPDGFNQVEADFTGAAAGSFPGFGSGGGSGANVGSILDPLSPASGAFNVSGEIEGFGGTGDYVFNAELQFQDADNVLGVTGQNPNNAIIISFQLTDANAAGGTAFSFSFDSSATFDRGSFADLSTLVAAGEVDNINININAGQGTNFYGADAGNGFRTRGVIVTQAIPEPSALAGLGLLAIGGMIGRRRRLT